MTLPDFIGIGAQKAGTTTLYHILSQHPQIRMAKWKEVHFFNKDAHYQKGTEWYAETLPSKPADTLIGEITPAYLFHDDVPERIYRSLDHCDVKFIVMLRDPIDRAYSHFLMNKRDPNVETLSFQEAIDREGERIRKNPTNKGRYAYLTRSYYSRQIRRYFKYFSKDQMCFVIFERLKSDHHQDELGRLYDFLGIKRAFPNEIEQSNPTKHLSNSTLSSFIHAESPTMKKIRRTLVPSKKLRDSIINFLSQKPGKLDDNMKKELREKYFTKEIHELENLIDRDLCIWKYKN